MSLYIDSATGKLIVTPDGKLVNECPPCWPCPDQFDVAISADWADSSCVDCPDLPAMNTTHNKSSLCSFSDDLVTLSPAVCLFTLATVSLSFAWTSESNYGIQVGVLLGFDLHVFEKLGITSGCGSLSGLVIPWKSSSGKCTAASCTCTITAV